MARMSIDDRFLREPRVKRMAAALGWSVYEARGRLLEVYAIVYDMVQADREPLLTALDIDAAADFVGLADNMIAFDLAVKMRGGIHVRGSLEYTGYLSTRKESGRAGGIKSGESRRSKAKQIAKVTFAKNEGPSNPPDPVPDQASASAPDQASDNPQEREESAAAPLPFAPVSKAKRKPKPPDFTASERSSALFVLRKLTEQNGIAYEGAKDHLALIIGRLREGITEADMRKVIGYCALEKRWKDDEKFHQYLRPDTLFGPKTIWKYLDAARAWFTKNGMELEERPLLEVC